MASAFRRVARRRPRSLLVRFVASLGLVAGAATVASPVAALDFTVGDVVVQDLDSYGFIANSSVLSTDGGAIDQLYQMFGYLGTASGVVRVDGSGFTELSAITQVGNQATSTLELGAAAGALGLTAGDLRIDYTFTAIDDTSAADADDFRWDVLIENTSGSALDLVFYSYLDLDIDGAADFADDLVDANLYRMVVSDSTPSSTSLFRWKASSSGPADHFQVGSYPSVRNTLDGMASAQDLSDTPVSFGPADFTGAYQYDLSLAPGEIFSLGLGGVSVVPEPGTALLAWLGLLGIAGWRKGRRSR
jgi:MYXO-CTERM domain-containing protein